MIEIEKEFSILMISFEFFNGADEFELSTRIFIVFPTSCTGVHFTSAYVITILETDRSDYAVDSYAGYVDQIIARDVIHRKHNDAMGIRLNERPTAHRQK